MNTLHNIFDQNGCLTKAALEAIIDKTLPADKKLSVEKHIADCELCRDAVEGVEQFMSSADFSADVKSIQHSRETRLSKFRISRKTLYAILSVAASVTVLISIALFWQSEKMRKQREMLAAVPVFENIDKVLSEENIVIRKNAGKSANEKTTSNNSESTLLADFSPEESTLPVASLANASVYSSRKNVEVDYSGTIESTIKSSRSYIKYPYTVMGHAPASLHIELPEEKAESEDIFFLIEDMPTFHKKKYPLFIEYIQPRLRYPQLALERGISGTVYVQFTISRTGEVINPQIIKGVHPSLDNEVLRVVRQSPQWEPGRQRGRAVEISLVMPVDFVIE